MVGTGPGVAVRRRRWLSIPGVSARFRILAWCTLLVAGALTASVLATRVVLLRRLSREIDSELTHELAEVRALQRTRVDPKTRMPFADADHLLLAALAQAAPSRIQELVAVSDGRVIGWSPAAPILRLESDPELVRRWAVSTTRTFSTIHTSAGTVRVVAEPVTLQSITGPARDVFVAAVFVHTERAAVDATILVAAEVGAVALLLAVGLAWLIAGRVLAPVRDLEETARSITESDLTHRLVVNGDDELARLAATFNAMLDRVEGAFRSQRQFIDDAGHELRTPITVIRGHLELLGDDPRERAEVRTIVIDELDRMNRMVNELLLLARAERPDFLRLAEVDVGACTAEVQAKAATLADRDWLDGGRAQVVVVADRQRLTQAWMQLAQNAVQHTAAGDPIELGSRLAGDAVELWVGDSGPGVPDADREAIFQSFARPHDGSRSAEHFGFGLPIVRAIAEAHHGQVDVGMSNAGGALFTIRLPLSRMEQQTV
jgi:two-component system, OmpR family, sensor kinase